MSLPKFFAVAAVCIATLEVGGLRAHSATSVESIAKGDQHMSLIVFKNSGNNDFNQCVRDHCGIPIPSEKVICCTRCFGAEWFPGQGCEVPNMSKVEKHLLFK